MAEKFVTTQKINVQGKHSYAQDQLHDYPGQFTPFDYIRRCKYPAKLHMLTSFQHSYLCI